MPHWWILNATPRRPNASTSTSAGPDTSAKKPFRPSKTGRRARHAAARQHGGKDRIAPRFGVGKTLPVGIRLRPRLPHRNMVVEGEIDGLREPVDRQPHQLAGRQRDGRQAEHRRVPAAARHVEGVDQPAVDLVGERDRDDEVRRARALGLGDAQACRDIVARMTRKAAHIGVVQVVVAEGGPIGERREVGRAAPVGADDGRGAVRGRERDVAADAHRRLVECRDPAPDRVDDMRFDPFDGRGVEIVEAQPVRVVGEPFGERAGGLRPRETMDRRQRHDTGRQSQEFAAGKSHGAPTVGAPARDMP